MRLQVRKFAGEGPRGARPCQRAVQVLALRRTSGGVDLAYQREALTGERASMWLGLGG
jgi:hypothetical protein